MGNCNSARFTRLFPDKRIRMAQTHLRWQITVLVFTERTDHYNRVEWELLYSCRNIPATVFARYNELLSTLHCYSAEPRECSQVGACPTKTGFQAVKANLL